MSVMGLLGQVIGASLRNRKLLMWTGPPKRLAPALGIPLALGVTAAALRDPVLQRGAELEGARVEVTLDGRMVLVARADIHTGADILRAQGVLGVEEEAS